MKIDYSNFFAKDHLEPVLGQLGVLGQPCVVCPEAHFV